MVYTDWEQYVNNVLRFWGKRDVVMAFCGSGHLTFSARKQYLSSVLKINMLIGNGK